MTCSSDYLHVLRNRIRQAEKTIESNGPILEKLSEALILPMMIAKRRELESREESTDKKDTVVLDRVEKLFRRD